MPLLTRAEASGYTATSTHAEVLAFVRALAALGRPELVATSFGTSPEGRELPLLVLSSRGVADADAARALGRPIVLVINGIHAGEVEGKEAALMLVRDLLSGADPGLLDALTLVVVPLFNPDGNDAIDPRNRALDLAHLSGQDGPAGGVGTRVNAAGINLNRDYIRQEALEMRLLQARVCQVWRPDLTIDTHSTNGSVHRFDMTYDVPHTVESGRGEPIEFMRRVLLPEVTEACARGHDLRSGWYGNFVEDERALDAQGVADPAARVGEGWVTYPHHPRFGSNYRGLVGGLDLLLECYSYLPYAERVRTTYAWLQETLRAVARRPDEVRDLVLRCARPRERVAVRYALEAWPEPYPVPTTSPRTREGAPTVVRLPLRNRFVGTLVVDRPRAYAVPGALGPYLRGHGLALEPAPPSASVEVATLEAATAGGKGRAILEGAAAGARQVSWRREGRGLPAGTLLLPTEQPRGALAVYLCEPESDDGLFENGLLPLPAPGGELSLLRVLDWE